MVTSANDNTIGESQTKDVLQSAVSGDASLSHGTRENFTTSETNDVSKSSVSGDVNVSRDMQKKALRESYFNDYC